MPVQFFTQDDFETKVLKSDKPVFVDFYADWCGPCKMAEPILEELSDQYADKVIIGKVNVDEYNELAGTYGIMSIPTVLMFKNGEEVGRKIGFPGRSGYEEMLEELTD